MVAKEMLDSSTPVESTKTEILLDYMRDGAVSILKRWPEMKSKLHMCLNMPLPHKLRSVAWTLFMSDIKVRKEYLDKLMKDPKRAISKRDQVISETCESILKIQNTFSDIGPPAVGPFFAMKAVLSYFHTHLRTNDDLHHVYYLLMLPMLEVLSMYISKTKPAANNVVALLVEMYMTFIRDLPKYVGDIANEHKADRKTFSDKVSEHLVKYDADREGEDSMSNYIANLSLHGKSERKSVIESSVLVSMLSEVLLEVISPLILSMFVGFLNEDSLMFVWDQYVIGLDVAGYHMHFLPAFTATLFLLLKEDIMKCENVTELIATVQRESHRINVRLIQAKMRKLYYTPLYGELNQDDKAAVSAIDPTQVSERTWNHWNNAIIPEREGVREKQVARDGRQAERERLLRLRKEEEIRARMELSDQQRLVEERLREAAERERQLEEEERLRLQQDLEEERLRRAERDRSYEDELDKLRQEIEGMKRGHPYQGRASVASFASARAPPPSRSSVLPTFDPFYGKQYEVNKDPTAADILLDVISAVATKYKNLAHGEGREKDELNKMTKEHLLEHEDDVKQAQIEVFGRALKAGELEALPENENSQKQRQEVLNAVIRRVEQRWDVKIFGAGED